MKPILEWLNEAKEQGYDWADAAIKNYDPNFTTIKERESLKEALRGAFPWASTPETIEFWRGVHSSIRYANAVNPTPLESLIEDLGKLNSELENLEYNDTLKEPYRTQVYEATKASYEEQLAEVKEKIVKMLGIEPPDVKQLMEKLSSVKREFEAHKATAEELNRSYISEHNENYERMMKIEQLEKELESAKSRKLIGWVVQNEDGGYSKRTAPNFIKHNGGWFALGVISWGNITPKEAAALCGRSPKWSDDEPTPIYE